MASAKMINGISRARAESPAKSGPRASASSAKAVVAREPVRTEDEVLAARKSETATDSPMSDPDSAKLDTTASVSTARSRGVDFAQKNARPSRSESPDGGNGSRLIAGVAPVHPGDSVSNNQPARASGGKAAVLCNSPNLDSDPKSNDRTTVTQTNEKKTAARSASAHADSARGPIDTTNEMISPEITGKVAAKPAKPQTKAKTVESEPAANTLEAQAPEVSASMARPRQSEAKSEKLSSGAAKSTKSGSTRQGFKANEFIVYPAHGVGQIIAIEEQMVAGFKLELFVISFSKDKMTLKVPTSKAASVGMRKLAEPDIVKKAFDTLSGRARIKRTMWSRRAQEYEAKINSGDLIAIAEVVRDLFRSDSQPEQSYSERQLYEAALDRMAREIVVVQKMTETESLKAIEAQLQKGPRRGGKVEEIDPDEADIEEAA
jgi:CarD family transcriptional regulator